MISVIIPVLYNEYLFQAVNSVLEQNFKDFEIIIIDDGSTNDCKWFFFKDKPKVRVFHQKHKGLSSARNLGLKKAKGEWIKFFDADDIMLQGTLKFLNFHKNKTDIYCTDYEYIDENGKVIGQYKEKPGLDREQKKELLQQKMFGCIGSSIIHKSVFEKVGKFNEDLRYGEDYEYWLRAVLLHDIEIFLTSYVSFQYRIHDNQLSKNIGRGVGQLNQNIVRSVQDKI